MTSKKKATPKAAPMTREDKLDQALRERPKMLRRMRELERMLREQSDLVASKNVTLDVLHGKLSDFDGLITRQREELAKLDRGISERDVRERTFRDDLALALNAFPDPLRSDARCIELAREAVKRAVDLSNDVGHLKEECNRRGDRIASLVQELAETKSNLLIAQSDLAASKVFVADLERIIKETRFELGGAGQQERLADLAKSAMRRALQQNATEGSLAVAEQNFSATEKLLAETRKVNATLRDNLAETQHRLNAVTSERDEARALANQCVKERDEAIAANARLLKDHDKLRRERDRAQTERAEIAARAAAASDELAKLRSERDEAIRSRDSALFRADVSGDIVEKLYAVLGERALGDKIGDHPTRAPLVFSVEKLVKECESHQRRADLNEVTIKNARDALGRHGKSPRGDDVPLVLAVGNIVKAFDVKFGGERHIKEADKPKPKSNELLDAERACKRFKVGHKVFFLEASQKLLGSEVARSLDVSVREVRRCEPRAWSDGGVTIELVLGVPGEAQSTLLSARRIGLRWAFGLNYGVCLTAEEVVKAQGLMLASINGDGEVTHQLSFEPSGM